MNIDRMLFFDNIRKDNIIIKAVRIVRALLKDDSTPGEETAADYYDLQRALLKNVSYGDPALTYWQNYVLELTAAAENAYSLTAERGPVGEWMLQMAEGDIEDIQNLLSIDWQTVSERMMDQRVCVCCVKAAVVQQDERIQLVNQALAGSPEQAVRALAVYYREHLCGLFGRYRVFAWDGSLKGIRKPDAITFDDLIGYEVQQEQLIRNTEMFLEGKRANNVLLYGDKGTGKSSSVKALVNRFADRGLRMVSLPKDRIMDITEIMDELSGRGCRFLIFIDDLSFEATEIEYKKFKSVLEGDVEVRPDNVLVYVTSNRRNLVKELWSDRGDPNEVHGGDGIQESQSLADRFGLTITFLSPAKSLYNEMVLSIAEKEGLEIDKEELLRQANIWDMRQTGRSGRSARQFITHISGK